MKPVMQTRGYDPTAPAGQQRGNCWTACIASMLGLSIDEVPDFVQLDVDGGEDWWFHTLRWLGERGYLLIFRDPAKPGPEPYIQCGLSPRSPAADGKPVYHAVIYQGGQLIHDPHPDGLGVATIEDAYVVVPRDEVGP